MSYQSFLRRAAGLLLCLGLGACGAGERLANIGRVPPLSPIADPSRPAGAAVLPIATAALPAPPAASLWQQGSRAFFKDNRAARVGDILTVTIDINEQAQLANKTSRGRTNSEDLGLNNLFGLEAAAGRLLPSEYDPTKAVGISSDSGSSGNGTVDRKEDIHLTVAAVVTQVLPNGNLMIEGHQEVRVNYEVRELLVAGLVRPSDISATNTVKHTQMAEARISYGGRGQITDVQQPRYGQQLLDVVMPF